MDIIELWESEKEEAKRIEELYHFFDEEQRLAGPSHQIEFLTTMHYLKKVLKPDMKILDLGAGTGAYSLALEKLGYEVTAVELTQKNLQTFHEKLTGTEKIHLHQGTATDLSFLEDESFDVILLLGPLYHLEKETDRLRAIMEVRRVMKKSGFLFAAFINHDMIPFTETRRSPQWFKGDTYDHQSFRLMDFPFIFTTLEESRKMLLDCDLVIQREIASDGMSELLSDEIDQMDEETYQQYFAYHLLHCEDKEGLGRSNHFLFQCGQRESLKVSYVDDEEVKKEMEEFLQLPVEKEGFFSFVELEQPEINLLSLSHTPAMPEKNRVPFYSFEIRKHTTPVGKIDLRLGYTRGLYYGGNLGYMIDEKYRGNGYALEGCKLLKKVALKHGMKKLVITTDYLNQSSRRVCEKLGAKLMRTLQLPAEEELYQDGQRFICIYLWDLEA